MLMKLIYENGATQPEAFCKIEESSKGKKPGAAKLEMQKTNQQQYQQSKTALSKRVAELER
jgi:hypothetical protein